MNHIRFLSTNKAVCQAPSQLGYDFVVIGPNSDEAPCKPCLSLLMIHNKRHHEYDLLVTLPEDLDRPMIYVEGQERTPVRAALDVLSACVLTSFVWILAFLLLLIWIG